MSAPSSGHGKTAIAVGLLAALTARGIPAAGFKVGPDHTDAAYLGLAAGRPGRNLDPRLVGAQRVAPLFAHGAAGSQLAVVEGAMGLFDSLTGQPEVDGTAAVAAALRAPVVLVVDVAAMGHSLAALVHGFRMFDEMVHLNGVILNRVASARHEQMLRSAMDDIGMPVLGALHRGELPNVLPARTHGLVPVAHRTVEAGRAIRRLGEAVASMLDMDRLMALAASAPPLPGPIWTPSEAAGGEAGDQRPIIALAGGQGAPYTYVETAELLAAAGADVAVIDPLRDETLPPGTRGLVVGAGLPEGYAEELSANHRLSAAVAQFARDGWPVVAEGIAFPWLTRELDGRPMCGVLDATATTGEQTVAGYREATAPSTSVLAPAGARITGYKQHRAIVAPRAGATPAWTWSGGNPEGFVWRQVHASQLGLHWAAAPEIAKRLVAAALAGPSQAAGAQPGPAQAMPPANHAPAPHQAPNHQPASQPPPNHQPANMPPGGVPSGPAQPHPASPMPPMPPMPPVPMPPVPMPPMPPVPMPPVPMPARSGPARQSGAGSASQPSANPVMQPSANPVVQPSANPAIQPGSGPAVQPGSGPAVQPGPGAAVHPGSRPAVHPGSGPAVQQEPGPAVQPGSGPAGHAASSQAVRQGSGPAMPGSGSATPYGPGGHGAPRRSGPPGGMPPGEWHSGPHRQEQENWEAPGEWSNGPGGRSDGPNIPGEWLDGPAARGEWSEGAAPQGAWSDGPAVHAEWHHASGAQANRQNGPEAAGERQHRPDAQGDRQYSPGSVGEWQHGPQGDRQNGPAAQGEWQHGPSAQGDQQHGSGAPGDRQGSVGEWQHGPGAAGEWQHTQGEWVPDGRPPGGAAMPSNGPMPPRPPAQAMLPSGPAGSSGPAGPQGPNPGGPPANQGPLRPANQGPGHPAGQESRPTADITLHN
ncbi:cobyrinate a,c-diamide synthase [Actinoplanes sp. DH11]|uniref:cobyrinate a,c-diamide synthase n=1 Tax=Actinoplanes sp. DH11 TaxID=2857011 RepID=UPI001E28DD5B|nr:cobyrinate a,c-diamide synthase [Actinoplanes sp. DH11]